MNQYFSTLTKIENFNGNVIVAKKIKIIFQNSNNINGINDSFKITKLSIFIIASVSKVIIKVAILKLAEQNQLNLVDTIGKYITGFPNGNKITI